jgi:hypothetical protein
MVALAPSATALIWRLLAEVSEHELQTTMVFSYGTHLPSELCAENASSDQRSNIVG